MAEEKKAKNSCDCGCDCFQGKRGGGGAAASGGVYGLAFIGSLIYYIQNADTFVMGLLGVVKALLWPAFLIYKLLEFLKM